MKNTLLHLSGRLKSVAMVGALAICAVGLASASARADTFTFSFTNDPLLGNIPGTVTGEIIGLTNNSTSSAAEVIIETYPNGLASVFPSGPITATAWNNIYQNSFTETNGEVTAGNFWAEDTINTIPYGATLYINGEDGYNFVNIDGVSLSYVEGDDGFAAAHIEPLGAPVPEPSSLALLGIGLLGVMGLGIRTRCQVSGARCQG